VHLDHESCMEVTVLKGRGADVAQFANRIIAERGVRHGHVVYLPADGAHSHDADARNSHSPSHGHSHSHGHTHGNKRRKAG
jgi:CopG family nickel-responsive transcriptional regulator